MVFLTESPVAVVVLAPATAGGLVSLSESEISELLKLLLPLPSVFFATVAVGVAPTACCCCCFTNGNGILTTREDGVVASGVWVTSIGTTTGLLTIVLLGFCGSGLVAIGDLFSLHGAGPLPSFLLGTFRLADITVAAAVVG